MAFRAQITPAEATKLVEEQKGRTRTFRESDLRGKAEANMHATAKEIYDGCKASTKPTFSSKKVEVNVIAGIIDQKIYLYQNLKEIYSSGQTPFIGNCFEMTAQTCLIILPELKPDQEFFLEISSEDKNFKNGHVYGIIISRNILMGEGLTSPTDKKNFIEKFSAPFFNEGMAHVDMGKKNEKECAANTELFWKALGISNGKVSNQEVSSQAHLCDPWMERRSYCNGLDNCFSDEKIAQTYLMTLARITEIKIRTWVIPKELKSKINNAKYVECINENINQDILLLINEKIKPAAIKSTRKVGGKSELINPLFFCWRLFKKIISKLIMHSVLLTPVYPNSTGTKILHDASWCVHSGPDTGRSDYQAKMETRNKLGLMSISQTNFFHLTKEQSEFLFKLDCWVLADKTRNEKRVLVAIEVWLTYIGKAQKLKLNYHLLK